jgi:hypothetical protein
LPGTYKIDGVTKLVSSLPQDIIAAITKFLPKADIVKSVPALTIPDSPDAGARQDATDSGRDVPQDVGNYTMALTLDWGTDNCTHLQTVGQYRLVRNIPVVVDSSGNFSINFSTEYGYDNWTIEVTGTYVNKTVKFTTGKWYGDVYAASGRGPIANDSGTFSTNASGTTTATYSNVMTASEATNLSYAQPDTCAGAAKVLVSMM